jgi:hypothetical protein
MNNRIIVALLSTAMVSSAGWFVQNPAAIGQSVSVVSSSVPQSTAPSTTLSVRGTIDKYDAGSRTLSLTTSNGSLQLPLSSNTRIRRGWRKLEPAELEKLAGDQATVRYTEAGGNKIVESVHVFGK